MAMANDAINKAQHASTSSHSDHVAFKASHGYNYSSILGIQCPQTPPQCHPQAPHSNPIPGMVEFECNDVMNHPSSMASKISRNSGSLSHYGATDMDLKHNNNAFHIIATLITNRLLPKVNANPDNTHYMLNDDNIEFFQEMLPYSIR